MSNSSSEESVDLLLPTSTSTKEKLRKRKMEARNEHQLAKQYQIIHSVTTALGATLVILMFVWTNWYCGGFAWHSDYNLLFNWHPMLHSLGMIFLFGQSMLIYRTKRHYPKKTLKWLHGGIHLGAFICAIVSSKAVFDNHNFTNKPNLYSMHSWIGLAALILFSLQLVIGCVTFLYPGLSAEIRSVALPVHVAVGTACFFLAVGAAFMGLTEKTIWKLGQTYAELPGEAFLVNFMCVVLAFFAVLTLYLVNEPKFKRTNIPEDEIVLSDTPVDYDK